MFQNPREDTSFIEPNRYVVKLVKLEAMPPNPEHPDWAPSVRWYFNLASYPAMELLTDSSGEPHEFWQYTSTAMTPKSKARPWVEALLGRPLAAEDTGEAIGQALIGKKAIAMIGPNAAGRDAILSIQPYIAPAKAGARAAKPSAALAVLEEDLPPEQRTGAEADPNDPFAF